MAHRGQLRVCKGGDSAERPNIRLARQRPRLDTSRDTSQEEFHGFPEEEIRRGKKRKIMADISDHEIEQSPGFIPRRSKRLRKTHRDNNFIYSK